MMIAGGRDPSGLRSLREQAAMAEVAGTAAEIVNSPAAREPG